MKTFLLAFFMGCAILFSTFGQDRTDEKRWTIDPESGDTIYAESLIISRTEDITTRSNMIIINPLKFLLFYNISYFHKINDGTVIGGGIQVPTVSGITGFGINSEVRFYPNGINLRGFYIAPNISYNNLSGGDDNGSFSITSIGGLVGWQWFPGDQFAIGLGVGIDYYFFSGKNTDDDDFDKLNGTAPLLRFDIGYAW